MNTDTMENIGLDSAFGMREDEDFNVPATIVHADPFQGSYVTAQPTPVKRNETAILAKIKALANAKGEDYYYSWEVKNKDGTKGLIEGGTIKLADDLSAIYMNNVLDVRAIDCGDHWMLYARFADLENGTAKIRPFRQRKTQNLGKGFAKSGDAERALDAMMQIGASKAARNVVMHSLRAMWDEAVKAAKNAIANRIAANPVAAKNAIFQLLEKSSVTVHRAEMLIGRKEKEWTVPDMAKLWSILNSIKDGFINASDAFPAEVEPDQAKDDRDELRKFEEAQAAAKSEASRPTPPPVTPATSGPSGLETRPAAKPPEQPAQVIDRETGEITDGLPPAPEGLPILEPLRLDQIDLKTIKSAVEAAKALRNLLSATPDKEQRAQLFEASFGAAIMKTLNDKGQGAEAAKIKALL